MSLSEFYTIYKSFYSSASDEKPATLDVAFTYVCGGPWCFCSKVKPRQELCMIKLCDWKEITLNEAKELKELNSLICKYYKMDKQKQNMEKDFEE